MIKKTQLKVRSKDFIVFIVLFILTNDIGINFNDLFHTSFTDRSDQASFKDSAIMRLWRICQAWLVVNKAEVNMAFPRYSTVESTQPLGTAYNYTNIPIEYSTIFGVLERQKACLLPRKIPSDAHRACKLKSGAILSYATRIIRSRAGTPTAKHSSCYFYCTRYLLSESALYIYVL